MKNILVIGGSYFAGRVFVEKLVKHSGYSIHVFNRGNVPLKIDGVEHIRGDREIYEHITHHIPRKHWDVVVDFCAYTPEHISNMFRCLSGTVGHYIYMSTTSVYAPENAPPVGEDGLKVESSQTELGQFADYGLKKWQAECLLKQECSRLGVRYTILRPAIIYGRYNYAPRESWFFDTILKGKPLVIPGRAPALFSFVWVEDLARLIVQCLEQNSDEGSACYNVAGPVPFSYGDLLDILEKVCGRRPMVRKMALTQIYRQNIVLPFPPDTHLQYDGRKISFDFGFDYTPFSVGIGKSWQHHKDIFHRKK